MSVDREKWLNGWDRSNATVLIGAMVHCAACGKPYGLCALAVDDDHKFPDTKPDWPFNEKDCPLCDERKNNITNITIDELVSLGESVLRGALIKAKQK